MKQLLKALKPQSDWDQRGRVAVIPEHPVRFGLSHRIGIDQRHLALGKPVHRARLSRLGQVLFRAPQFTRDLKIKGCFALGFEPDHGAVCVHPESNLRISSINDRFHLTEFMLLPERFALAEWVGRKLDTDTAQLYQPCMFIPSISARDLAQKVAVRLYPQIYANLAVAERHGAGAVLAGRGPDDVVGIQGIACTQCRPER